MEAANTLLSSLSGAAGPSSGEGALRKCDSPLATSLACQPKLGFSFLPLRLGCFEKWLKAGANRHFEKSRDFPQDQVSLIGFSFRKRMR